MVRAVGIFVLIVTLLAIMGRCAGKPPKDAATDNAGPEAALNTAPPTQVEASGPTPADLIPTPGATGDPVPVPSDPGATYHLIEWREMPNGNREAITRRAGRSGTSFARREIDCGSMTFRYLGEGDTLEEARIDRPTPTMGELVPGSISTDVSRFVCSQ